MAFIKIPKLYLANFFIPKAVESLIKGRLQDVEELIEKLRKQNKEFYLDLEETVKIKLNDNLSEVRSTMEAGVKQFTEHSDTQIARLHKVSRRRFWLLLLFLIGIASWIITKELWPYFME